ncbi:response regulator transcription factor [Paraflavitalea sp. CAU 1676]|uniref:LytR/AlgR family response regulator transcription factor n=1 Tax=Paraflavitalea sp. CAU 1676 TaxID=3032598 RepID=UPI0023DAA2AD|nr:response regulator transcription factor [Paraflavitalea sp. CAU 1676]MDF2190750.1 response regulator [Paraflavitalea sp. CAU 1676]
MIRTVLIDDEPNNIDTLQHLLDRYCPQVQVVGRAESAQSGVAVIQSTQPDLVFLDIEMPYGNAFDLLNSLNPIQFDVIFVTAFDNYAINAIRYSALDYLLKPVNIKELQLAVQKAADQLLQKNMHKRIDTLFYNLSTPKSAYQRLALPTLDGLVFVNTEDVIRMEAKSNYTVIYFKNGSTVTVSKTLKEFEDILSADQFSRIHHSHIINHHFVKKYHRGRGGYIEMEDGTSIEVSIRKRDEFLSKFGT